MATAERSLPITAEHREFTVTVDGEAVPRTHQLLSASIGLPAQHVAWARLAYLDGAAAAGDFPLSASPLFAPGAKVRISAGGGDESNLLFDGLVVKQSLRLREASTSQLVVDCRHAATKLTVTRRSMIYLDLSDADLIQQLLSAAGLSADIDGAALHHDQLVQAHCTDWDFIVARARANGLLVLPRADRLVLKAPDDSAAPRLTLQHGATLLELDAQIDARLQPAAVQVRRWDIGDQAAVDEDAAEPPLTGPGDFAPAELAAVHGVATETLPRTALASDEARALGSAAWQSARADKASGRAKCEGLGQVLPGDVVTLAGCGARLNGPVFVTGVRHEMDVVQGWRTHLQFGGLGDDDALDQRLNQPPTPALLAPVHGLQIGVVTALADAAGEFRVRVHLPLAEGAADGLWARVASLDAGDQRGFVFRPEVGDEVVLGFLDNDPRHPIVLGQLHSSAKPAHLAGDDANPLKGYRSRSGIELSFDDEKKTVTLKTPGDRRLVLDDDAGSITLGDAAGNRLTMDDTGITLESAQKLTLKCPAGMALESSAELSLQAATSLTLEGSASAELKGGGMTKIVGGQVLIN